jgi:hypothetical protein
MAKTSWMKMILMMMDLPNVPKPNATLQGHPLKQKQPIIGSVWAAIAAPINRKPLAYPSPARIATTGVHHNPDILTKMLILPPNCDFTGITEYWNTFVV